MTRPMRPLMYLALIAGSLNASELRLALHSEPKTLDPLVFADESAEAIRYLTEGVLIRINRLTQQPEPELAGGEEIPLDQQPSPRMQGFIEEITTGAKTSCK